MGSKETKYNRPAPLSKNQKQYLRKCMKSWFNVAEGGKRGGKNVLQTLAFCICLDSHKDKLHLVSGVSVATAMLNVVDCDGYGIMNYFDKRCRIGKYNERTCLYIDTIRGQKIVLVNGGGKNGDEKLIKGQTFGMAYITEVNECHPNFVQEVFDRTLSSSDRKIFHDLNPKSPEHWYYTDVLNIHDRNSKKYKNYGYNYGHFTIVDNFSISNEKLKNILKTYDKNSIWYKRDILGQRIATEGIIYQQFAENNRQFIETEISTDYMIISIGIDYGASKSATSMKCIGITNGYKKVFVLEEKDIHGVKSPELLYNEFAVFYKYIINKYKKVNYVFCDYGALGQVITNGLQKYCLINSIPVKIKDCTKGKIIDRIQLLNQLIAEHRFVINKTCTIIINALNSAVWDDKKEDTRLDNGTSDIDSLDSLEYAIYPFRSKLIKEC